MDFPQVFNSGSIFDNPLFDDHQAPELDHSEFHFDNELLESIPQHTNEKTGNPRQEEINSLQQILQTKHPLIFQTFTEIMNGNIISLGCEFALHKKEFEEYYNWHVSVIADLMGGIPADVPVTKEEMTIINDILFTTYWMCYGNVNKGSIFVV